MDWRCHGDCSDPKGTSVLGKIGGALQMLQQGGLNAW